MPMWLNILMTIIGNIPNIIKAIRSILALLRGQPEAVQKAMKLEMKKAFKDCAKDKDHGRLLIRLEALLARLRSKKL